MLLAVSLVVLALAVVWFGITFFQQAAELEARQEENTTQPVVKPEDFSLTFGSGPSLSEEQSLREIPGLSEMDVIGYLQYIPGTNFHCPVRGTDRGLSKRGCKSSSEEDPAVYEVTVASEAGVAVSVVATSRDAPDDEASKILGRVAKLAVGGLGPLNPEAWVNRSIYSGGQYLAKGAEVRLYGTEGDRTLEIVGTGLPSEEPPHEGTMRTNAGEEGKDEGQGAKAGQGVKAEANGKGKADGKGS